MEIEYEYFSEEGYIVSKPVGVISLGHVQRYFERLLYDDEIVGPFIEVVDLSGVEEFAFGYFEADELVATVKPLVRIKGYQGACLVIRNDISRSIANILSTAGRDVGVSINTFRSLDDARQFAALQH